MPSTDRSGPGVGPLARSRERAKPVLALVHGWGMNARAFDALARLLADAYEVRALDLPGHGGREPLAENTLESWADDLAQQLPQGATLLGWSLGGQVAMRAAADHPHKVSRLVLLATTPKFVAASDWPHGMAPADLAEFGADLLADPRATLLRFLTLQTRGMDGQKALLQQLRQTLLAAPAPAPVALEAGLAMLRGNDLRDLVKHLRQPVLVVHGALDTLSAPAAGAWLAGTFSNARHVELRRAAHAPHLSHVAEVVAEIRGFVRG